MPNARTRLFFFDVQKDAAVAALKIRLLLSALPLTDKKKSALASGRPKRRPLHRQLMLSNTEIKKK